MKELSIEQKAKAYDIAFDKIKMLLGTGGSCSREELEYVFPGLKESYEERISKAIIDFFSEPGRKEYILNGFTVGDIIAWLEKQGDKQKPVVIIPKFRVGDTIRIKNSDAEYTITEISDGCYRGKGWCLDIAAGDKCGDYELVENKTAGWSKEDERDFDVIRGIIYNSCNAEDASRLIAWLKSIKARVQPKQEWNKEDINMID